MVSHKQALRAHPLFAPLSRISISRLSARSSLNDYAKGSIITEQGEHCHSLFLILTGRCESWQNTPQGDKLIGVLGPGDLVGQEEILYRRPCAQTTRVVTDCLLLEISGEDVQSLLAKNHRFASHFVQKGIATTSEKAPKNDHLGRVVTLASFDPEWSHDYYTEHLGNLLHGCTNQAILSVELNDRRGYPLPESVDALAKQLKQSSFWEEELEPITASHYRLCLRIKGSPHEAGHIPYLLSHLNRTYPYVLIYTSFSQSVSTVLECMIQSDLSFLFLRADNEDIYLAHLLNKELQSQITNHTLNINPILLRPDQGQSIDPHSIERRIGVALHDLYHSAPPGSSFARGQHPGSDQFLKRLARTIGRCRVGLALSSGGAKGLAHIGVIQVLEENGIDIDVVAGSSMGSYVGSLWCHGNDGQKLEELASELNSQGRLLKLVDPVFPPRRGFIRGFKVKRNLQKTIGEASFADLQRPLRVVATKLYTLEREVFRTGSLASAVHASIAIPGICVPVTVNGEEYIDGGICDPLPVDVLEDMGIERIIAVSTVPSPEHIINYLSDSQFHYRERNLRSKIWDWTHQRINYFAKGNILDILLRSVHGAQIRVAESSAMRADVFLRPVVLRAPWHDYTHYDKYIELGRKVTEDKLAQIQQLVSTQIARN